MLGGWRGRAGIVEAPCRKGGGAWWEGKMTGTIYIQAHNAVYWR